MSVKLCAFVLLPEGAVVCKVVYDQWFGDAGVTLLWRREGR